jgi:parallel beta-helix repeat protein
VTTNGSGDVSFSIPLSGASSIGEFITATATDPNGNTSEFSACRIVTAGQNAQTFTVTNANDSGAGSLRQAMQDANTNTGFVDTIRFNVPGTGPFTINLASPLPTITDPVVIDATTEPNYTNAPLVELNGAGAGPTADGFFVTAGGTTIRGFAINRFGIGGAGPNSVGGAGIVLQSAGNNIIEANFIGTDPSGTIARPNRSDGIFTEGTGNRIGGSTTSARNLISGNGRNGITVNLPGTANTQIQGDLIGTDITGTQRLANSGDGVVIFGATNTTVGGPGGARNVISGNGRYGVNLLSDASSNVIQNNVVGATGAGTAALGNGAGGIAIVGSNNSIVSSGGASEPNIIAFNDGNGISVTSGTGNRIAGNRIFSNTGLGIDLSGGDIPTVVLDFEDQPDSIAFPARRSQPLTKGSLGRIGDSTPRMEVPINRMASMRYSQRSTVRDSCSRRGPSQARTSRG